MNNIKKIISTVFCLFILGVTLFPMTALAYPWPGEPGGSPPPPPYLYSPPSPDYDGDITLTWRSSDGATEYRIYRSTNYYWGYGLIALTPYLSYTDQGLIQGYWYYMVKARNDYGMSPASNKIGVEVILEPPDPVILSQPTTPNYNGIIDLQWSSSPTALSYKIYRSLSQNSGYECIGSTSYTWYTDTVDDVHLYWYRVIACIGSRESDPSNAVFVNILSTIWYEWNKGYNIGDFPSNEWNLYDGDIEVVKASTYNVNTSGKVIRMSESRGCAGMTRVESYPFIPEKSLYFKFKAQVSQVDYGEVIILLAAENTAKFFEITFDSYNEEIKINMANEQFYHLDLTFNQIYDFDIIFLKIPDSNIVQYYVFINQKLEITGWVNTVYYPLAIDIQLEILDGGPGEFFLDNFFLGYVEKEVFPEEYIEIAVPMYYLYSPEFVEDDDIERIDMKYRYKITETHTITTSISMGFSFRGILSLLFSTPLYEVITFYATDECEVSTNRLDLVIFNLIEASKRDLTFYLPGLDPETGASNITVLYDFTILNQSITKYNIDHFESVFGKKPENFDYCKNYASYVKPLTFKPETQSYTEWKSIESRNLKSSYSYTIAATLGFKLGKYVKFNLGLLFTFSYSCEIETDASVGITWSTGADLTREVIVNIFAPPIGSYSTPLDLPPYSAEQVV